MKIALVTQPYDGVLPPRQNSIGLILYNTAIELSRHASVDLYMKRAPDGTTLDGYPFALEQIDAGFDDLLTSFAGRYPRWSGRLGLTGFADQFPQYVHRVRAGLSRNAPDIVHTVNYWSWCRDLSSRTNKHKVVLEMQAEWLSQMNAMGVQRQLKYADAVVTVSDHVSNLFKRAFPGYPGLVETVYNGVDTDVFKPAPAAGRKNGDEKSILFVGRTSPEKGVHVLIQAFQQVAALHDDARLHIAGPRTTLPARHLVGISDDPVVRRLLAFYDGTVNSDYQSHLNNLVRSLGLEHKVRFHGSLPHSKLVELYQNSDVVCNPSFSESFGISIVEGMACGIPVIGANTGGMKETILHGETGFIVEPDEPDALAAAIKAVFADSKRAKQMGAYGRTRATTHFTWTARAHRLLKVYERTDAQDPQD